MSRSGRRQASVLPGEALPPMGSAVAAGMILGAAIAGTLAWGSESGLIGTLACALLGVLAGAVLAVLLAAHWVLAPWLKAIVQRPADPDRGGVWDRWLDAEAVVAAAPWVGADDDEPEPPFTIRPARVRPRIVAPETGEAMVLEEEVRALAEAGGRGAIRITGPVGSGKTMALGHLAAVLPKRLGVCVLDNPDPTLVDDRAARGVVVYAADVSSHREHLATYKLAPWGEDERIEYLLAANRARCASVMMRLKAATDRDGIAGSPELWRIVLDRMAGDASITSVKDALRQDLADPPASDAVRQHAENVCLALAKRGDGAPPPPRPNEEFVKRGRDRRLLRLIRHRPIQLLIAADRLVAGLARNDACACLGTPLPHDFVIEAGEILRKNPVALDDLRRRLSRPRRSEHPMAASLLHAAATGWRPQGDHPPRLSGAYLARAAWSGVDLRSAELVGTDLSFAELGRSRLDDANLHGARLRLALLGGASLENASAQAADLSGAILEAIQGKGVDLEDANLERAKLTGAMMRQASLIRANLTGARLICTNLTRANLTGARIEDADFTAAILDLAQLEGLTLSRADFTDARFQGADLTGCNLEGIALPGANFREARLVSAHMTGSVMPGADFRGANLRTARLAEVDWEGACLAGADLRTANFHLGSARSGLVGSPIACEGSRTGFYTDEYDEQDFKPPEEIRKANLCGTDLRGALIDDVDFYLVDLRGAQFDLNQAHHFRRCGAILRNE